MIKLLWCGDAVAATGFSRITHSTLDELVKLDDYSVDVLGVNYGGDPHGYDYRIWPAKEGGDYLGYNRLNKLIENQKPDVLILFNDLWVITKYLKVLKDFKGKVIVYFPVDASGYDESWIPPINDVDAVAVYTHFAEGVLREVGYKKNLTIIPHGIDLQTFHPIDKQFARTTLNGLNSYDYVVFNGNRNQPRKRIDITVKAFCQFAADKPNARLYLHMGLTDIGWSIIPMMTRECKKAGITDAANRLVITNPNLSPMSFVTVEDLNRIYNTADVGINTSLGEGWGLVNFEHSACGVPQIIQGFYYAIYTN